MSDAQLVDDNGNPVPVMKPVKGSDYAVSVSGTTARNSNEITEDVVGIYVEVDTFIKIGDNSVEASESVYDAFLPATSYREYEVKNNTHIAGIKKTGSGDGVMYINGLK